MQFSNNVLFIPWVGNNYYNTNPKIMILGESLWHDNGHPDDRRISAYIIDQINNGEYVRFFDKIQDIYRLPHHGSSVNIFWHDVCFSEYVQELLPSSKHRPTRTQWTEAQDSFKEVVCTLEPDIVIAQGFATFNYLPNEGEKGKTFTDSSNNKLETWIYNWSGKSTIVLRVEHPSSRGFSSRIWKNLWRIFLKSYQSASS